MKRTNTTTILTTMATGGLLLGNTLVAQQYQDQTYSDQQRGYAEDRSVPWGRNQASPQQQSQWQQMSPREQRLRQQVNVVRAEDLIGTEVQNLRGETLGSVHDIVISQPDGVIAYVVVASGGFLGVGQDLHAIEPQAFRFSGDENLLLTDMSAQQFNQYLIDDDNWPHPSQFVSNAQPHWQVMQQQQQPWRDQQSFREPPYQQRDQYSNQGGRQYESDESVDREVRWGFRQFGENGAAYQGGARGDMQNRQTMQNTQDQIWAYRVSELQGLEVIDRQNNTAGEIQDFALDLRRGRVLYALVDVNGWAEQQLVAVPFQALQLDRQEQAFRTQMSGQMLAQGPRITDQTDLSNPRIAQQIDQFWGESQVYGFPGQEQQFRQQPRPQQQWQQQPWGRQSQPPMQQRRGQWQQQQWQQQQQPYRGQQQMMQHRSRRHQPSGVEMRGTVQDVQQFNGQTQLQVQAQDGRNYAFELPQTVRLYIAPDGRALLLAEDVYRDGHRISRQEVYQLREQMMQMRGGPMMQDQWQTYGFQQGQQGERQPIVAQIQQAQRQQDQARIQLEDQQGRSYTAQIGSQAQIHVYESGQAGVLLNQLTSDGQSIPLQPSRQMQQMRSITLRGQIQQIDENQIRFQSQDGQVYTLELGDQIQIGSASSGQPILIGQSLMRNGQEVQFQTLQQQQQQQYPQQQFQQQ